MESLTQGGGDSEETRTEDERRDRRGVKRALIILLALFVFLFGGTAVFVGYLGYTVNDNITQQDMLPETRQPLTAPDGTTVAEKGTGTNFLVIGADTRPGDAGRSDVIVLVHIPEDGKTITMIHFPRDLYVDVPGPRQGQDQRRVRLRPRAAPRGDHGEPAQDPHPPRGEDELRGLQEA